jgi:pimeloyl-ACP methyl ester carboxylesterase
LRDDFRVYPYVFLKHGFAVLTFDKRGAGDSAGNRDRSEEGIGPLADDLNAAVAFLRGRPDVIASKVGVLGISHGSWVAVEAAARDPKIGFVIPIVGGGTPLWRAQLFDLRNSITEQGLSPADQKAALAEMAHAYALAQAGNYARVASRLYAERNERWFTATPAAPLAKMPPDAIEPVVKSLWEGELSYDPGPRLALICAPILGIAAESDRHVPPDETLAGIRKAAASKNVQTVLLPKANHWQGMSRNYTTDIHYSGRLFDRLGTWLERVKRQSGARCHT